jgi:hypothetical protein
MRDLQREQRDMFKICERCQQPFITNRATRRFCGKRCSNQSIAIKREEVKSDIQQSTVWSCGGGVDSTAIAVLISDGRLPKPDLAVMVDTGYEKQATWQHDNDVLIPRLATIGVTLNIIKTADYGDPPNLLDNTGHVVIPAYRRLDDGKEIKFHSHCNNNWKVRVTRSWLRAQGVERTENWIGIAADEDRRARESPIKWLIYRYPLIELGLTRADCIFLIGQSGWPMPPRTSCIFCPLQDDRQWRLMRDKSPDDWQRALMAEKEIQQIDSQTFLHYSCAPLDQVEFGRK